MGISAHGMGIFIIDICPGYISGSDTAKSGALYTPYHKKILGHMKMRLKLFLAAR